MVYFDTKAYQLKLPYIIYQYVPTLLLLCGVLLLVCLTIGIALLVVGRRNDEVCSFRLSLVNMIFEKSKVDGFKDYEWRLKEFEKISYRKMLYMFWRRLKPENFYKNLDFLA